MVLLILSLVRLENIILMDKNMSDDSPAMGIRTLFNKVDFLIRIYNSESTQFPVEFTVDEFY